MAETSVCCWVAADRLGDLPTPGQGAMAVDGRPRVGSETTTRLSGTAIDVLLNDARIWVATCDAAGNLDFVSPALQELFGFPFSNVTEADIVERYQLFAADACTPLASCDIPLLRAHRGEIVRDAIIATRVWDGDARFLSCNAAPLFGDNGSADGAVVVVREVTAEVAAERERDVLRDRLVTTFNHEFRTPLTKLVGHAELLDDLLGPLTDGARKSLTAVQVAAAELQTAVEMISGLVDAQQRMRVRRTLTDVSELVDDIGRACTTLAESRRRRLMCRVPLGLLAEIDPYRTREAISALMRNALHYAPEASEIELELTWGDGNFSVLVCDHGPGIDFEERARLVKAFERGTDSQQPLSSWGLGLAVARATAIAHGGQLVLADNKPGLRAALTLPRCNSDSEICTAARTPEIAR